MVGRTLYALLVWAALHGSVVECGYAPHYSAGLMKKVALRRDISPVSCMVSRPRGPLGGWVWVYGVNTQTLLRCKIVDVSAPRDLARHVRTKRIAELSFEVTAALCGRTDERVIDCPIVTVGVK